MERLVKQLTPDISIIFNIDLEEYQVKMDSRPQDTHHTADKQDAFDTAAMMEYRSKGKTEQAHRNRRRAH